MNRRTFLGLASIAPVFPALSQTKPNIIVIVGDDLGYAEIGAYGGEIPTPHIDSLAKNGVRFTDGYVSCPVCSPTRAGLITGRYQQRFGHEMNPGPPRAAEDNFGLPLTETTLATQLKSLGYKTGMVGKWHLGYKPEYHPMKRGFDEYFGFLGGAHSYVDANADSANPILRGTERVDEREYLTDAFTREAVAYIGRHAKEPFFLYLTYNAVHGPLQATEKYLSRFPNITDQKRKTFAAMLSAMDDGVGQVLGKLKSTGIEQNTLIFFISDNGGPTPQTTSRNNPLRATKGTVYEGGIRVPFLMQWKARAPSGITFNRPVIALDIFPTAVVAAGGSPDKKLDGVDLVSRVKDRSLRPVHESLYWRFGQQWAIRQGDWKLLSDGGTPQLFNLAQDVGESKDLSGTERERASKLLAAYQEWNSQLVEPKWRRERAQRNRAGKKRRR